MPAATRRDREAAAAGTPRTRPDYARIATELRDARSRSWSACAPTSRRAVRCSAASIRRARPLERDLAEFWAELLNVTAVGIHDNFFDLGGHSLLAVQLLSRVRQIYGVELSLEVVYSGEFTVAELAKAVELKEIEQAGGDYQELLAGTRGPVRRRSARAAGRRAGRHLAACGSC